MGFCVLVPARMASTRLPDKPLADLAGKPMVVRVAERARLSRATRVVVATDSEAVLRACERHGVEALMTPITYLIVNSLKRAESEDYYDRNTNFNPFVV